MPDKHDIIEMQLDEGDDGELHYAQAGTHRSSNPFSGLILKILGTVFGVLFFLLLIAFFIYIVIPLILILILFSMFRRFFKK